MKILQNQVCNAMNPDFHKTMPEKDTYIFKMLNIRVNMTNECMYICPWENWDSQNSHGCMHKHALPTQVALGTGHSTPVSLTSFQTLFRSLTRRLLGYSGCVLIFVVVIFWVPLLSLWVCSPLPQLPTAIQDTISAHLTPELLVKDPHGLLPLGWDKFMQHFDLRFPHTKTCHAAFFSAPPLASGGSAPAAGSGSGLSTLLYPPSESPSYCECPVWNPFHSPHWKPSIYYLDLTPWSNLKRGLLYSTIFPESHILFIHQL